MASAYPRPGSPSSARRHAHRLPPPPPSRRARYARRALLHRARTSTATWTPPRRPGSPSWASPSTSTASPRRSSSGATRSGSSRRATTSTPTASSCAATPLRLGIECDFIPGAEDRTAALLEARDFDYVVGSVHFVGDAAVDHHGWDVWEGNGDPDEVWRRYFEALAECARSGLFDILAHPDLVKVWGGARPLPQTLTKSGWARMSKSPDRAHSASASK